ncbi:competence type IV pilus minor pilin ComGD [Oceanobacillus salinisoli]|uniref:competence type IV pilus minor pilin ComGD n=1 Tax=Oceanobacillus salinisoli TaxID=2678611 RepID=UPI0012E137D0|nr:competence type IV pilus minor pilin ComGD [Oceanobacillus salinisoli]
MTRNNKGFTLMEVLFVLATLSVITLLSPSMNVSSLETIQEQQFLTVFQSDVLYTQNLSTTTEEYVRIRFYTDNYKIKSGSETLITRYYPNGIQLDTRGNPIIVFKITGAIVNRKIIKVTTNQAVYHIVFPLGKGRINIVEI